MTRLADLYNSIMTGFFAAVLWPWRTLAPVWGLIFISILSGVVLLLMYGRVSNQRALKDIKRKISAALLEAIIYRHDLALSLRAQAQMFRGAAVYFLRAIPPILILMVPCLAILAQLNLFYSARSLQPGESALMRVKVNQTKELYDVTLAAPASLDITPPLRIPENNEIIWRLNPGSSKPQTLTLAVKDKPWTEEQIVHSGEQPAAMPSRRFSSPYWALLYPGAKTLPRSSIWSEIRIDYPAARYSLLGVNMHWLVVFAVFSILSGLIASKVFKVEI